MPYLLERLAHNLLLAKLLAPPDGLLAQRLVQLALAISGCRSMRMPPNTLQQMEELRMTAVRMRL